MKSIEESKIDWYNTRGGRKVMRDKTCDRITLKDIVGYVAPKKKQTSRERRGLGYVAPRIPFSGSLDLDRLPRGVNRNPNKQVLAKNRVNKPFDYLGRIH